MDYTDLDLHLSLVINEAWAEGRTKPYSQYMPRTAKVAGQLIAELRKAERKLKRVKPTQLVVTQVAPGHEDFELLYSFLKSSMKLENT